MISSNDVNLCVGAFLSWYSRIPAKLVWYDPESNAGEANQGSINPWLYLPRWGIKAGEIRKRIEELQKEDE